MITKEEFQANIEARLNSTQGKIEKMKANMAEAGDSVSDESREALAKAEELLFLK